MAQGRMLPVVECYNDPPLYTKGYYATKNRVHGIGVCSRISLSEQGLEGTGSTIVLFPFRQATEDKHSA
jgi:hypothetical protein